MSRCVPKETLREVTHALWPKLSLLWQYRARWIKLIFSLGFSHGETAVEVKCHLPEKALLRNHTYTQTWCQVNTTYTPLLPETKSAPEKNHNMTSSSIEPSAKHARVDTLERHSNVGSCGLRAAACGSCQHVVPVRPSRHVPGWRGLTAAVVWQKVQGKNFLARMGRLCLACSNEHGSWLVGKSEQRLETERPRGLIVSCGTLSEFCFKIQRENT